MPLPDLSEIERFGKLSARLKLLISLSNSSVFIYVNSMWTDLLGWSQEELLGRPYIEFIHPEDRDPSIQRFSDAKEGVSRSPFRNRYRKKDGSYVTLEWVGMVIGEHGFSVARDVSQVVKSEERLRVVEQVVLNAADIIMVLDFSGKIVSWNMGAMQTLGWTSKEMLGKFWVDVLLTDENQEQDLNEFQKVVTSTSTQIYETAWRKANGGFVDLAVSLSPVKDYLGRVHLISVVARNITGEIKLAATMRQVERLAQIGGWEIDLSDMSVEWTDETYRIHGVPNTEKLRVDSAIEFYPEPYGEIISKAVDTAITEGKPYDLELQIRRRDGVIRWVRTIGHTVFVDGVAHRLFGTFQDISAVKEAKVELDRARDHLAVSEKLTTLGSLSAAVAHEINNPLAILLGEVAMLRRLLESDQFDQEQFDQELVRIESTVTRMARIVENLRSFSRTEMVTPELHVIEIMGLLRLVVDLHRERIEKAGVRVEWNFDRPQIEVKSSETQLFQIFSNLLGNSLDALASTKDRRIRISVKEIKSVVEVRVCDNGIGIPPDVRPRIFDAFFTSKGSKGSGMGLNISRRLAEQVNGQLWFDENYGPTCFVVELPRAQGELAAEKAKFNTGPLHAKVLLVEDEPDLAESLKYFLEDEGFLVQVANSGGAAFKLLEGEQFDVILCDYRLPDFSGEELMRRLPQSNRRWIFMTGYSDVLTSKGTSTENYSVLRKPVPFAKVVEEVRKSLTRSNED